MELKDLFYHWVPLYLRLPALFIMLLAALIANGIFLGTANEIANDLGVYAEPFTAAYNALYIGFGLGLIFHYRLKLRFTNKRLLLYGFTMMLVMNIVCATTSNPTVFVFACLLIGFTKVPCLIEVYVIWMYIWSKKLDTSRLYPFIYFTALSGIYLSTWLTALLAYHYNWRFSYIAVIILLLLCILSGILLAQNNELRRPFPLYQVDFLGLIMLAASMMLLNYAVVYSKVEDWFASNAIAAAYIVAFLLLLIFLRRQLALKRPLFDLKLFQISTFRTGLFYFFILGLFLPGNAQAIFSGGVLQYDAPTNTELNLYLIPGIGLGCVLCYCWYYYQLEEDMLIIAGFASLIIYHLLIYQALSVNFAKANFVLPLVIKGFGTALTYIAIGLLTTRKLRLDQVIGAAGAMILVRSFLGSGIFTSLYTYFLYVEKIRHVDYLAGSRDSGDFITQAQARILYPLTQQQATLAAAKAFTGWILLIGGCWIFLMLIKLFFKRIKPGLSV